MNNIINMSNMSNMSDRYLTDHFLIAMPGLRDKRFHQAVMYICAHDQNGALGIVINKPLDMMLGEIWFNTDSGQEKKLHNLPMYDGGPMKTGEGFMLCQDEKKIIVMPWQSSDDQEPSDLAMPLDSLATKVRMRNGNLENILIALGYAGWTAGQLEQEMQDNSWLSVVSQPHIIFDTPVEQRWSSAAGLLGVNTNRLSSNVGHA